MRHVRAIFLQAYADELKTMLALASLRLDRKLTSSIPSGLPRLRE
jgi:hypothetical protein